MIRLLFLLLSAIPLLGNAQFFKDVRKKSYQTLVFKIDAATAEKCIKKNDINVDAFSEQPPFCVFNADAPNTDSLPTGHYVLLTIKDSMVNAEIINSTQLVVYSINNQRRVQIEVRDKNGKFITDAQVFLNNKPCSFNSNAGNFVVPKRKPDEALIKVYAKNDTTFLRLSELEDRYNNKSVAKQNWDIFKLSKLGKAVVWIPNQIKKLFSKNKAYKPTKTVGTRGLMVFNQPKYKINDTVRLKAYLYNRKNKMYNKQVSVYLEYYKPGKGHVSQKLSDVKPTDNGSFIYEFILRDTLTNDIYYTIVFKNEDAKQLLRNSFKLEDYVLDEVATYSLRSEKEDYYRDDTLRFYANAKDANGLNLLDGTARLILTADKISNFYKDKLQVPDTIFSEEKKLETQGDTKFTVPAQSFPQANLAINALLIFKNSNNEIQEKKVSLNYKFYNKEIIAKQVADTIFANVFVDGKIVAAKGKIKIDGKIIKAENINFPFKIKIDPLVSKYSFEWIEKDSVIDFENVEIGKYYDVTLSRISVKDTLGFVLNNPYKIPVNYSVFKNNQLLAIGKGDGERVEWKKTILNKHQMYTVKYQYIWAGEELSYQENISLLYKLLDIKVKAATTVFPWQRDSIEITTNDYKNNPVANVNLTAFSYNNQFKEKRAVPDPPYLQTYKLKPQVLYKKYEKDDAYVERNYSLGKHTLFIKKFGVDTMLYYRILFPSDSINDVANRVDNYFPQISVHAVDKGVPQQVFMLYLNNRLVYYYNATGAMPYAFSTMHGYAKIAFRLLNKYVEIDSVYVQPFYKHDFVFDVNKLPARSKITDAENYLSDAEKNILENSLFQIELNYPTTNSYLWQGDKLVYLTGFQNQITRPFAAFDSMHFFAPGRFDVHFIFEPTYRYRFSDKILRLEKSSIFPGKEKYYLKPQHNFNLMLGDTITQPPLVHYDTFIPNEKRIIKVDDYFLNQKYASMPCGALQLLFKKDTSFIYMILKPLSDSNRVVKYFAKRLENIPAGNYQLLLVMKDLSVAAVDSITILQHSTLCLKINQLKFAIKDKYVETVADENVYKPKPAYNSFEPLIISKEDAIKVYPPGNAKIKGTIVDAKGQLPIAGAYILVKGTNGGATSSVDGSFVINNIKPGNYTIVVSYIGYDKKEIKVAVPNGGMAEITVLLTVSNQSLDEVVVIGYGSVKRRDLTGSVTSISTANLQSVSFDKSLQGKAAGVMANSGVPGGGVTIQVHGIATIGSSNTPIVVIDGIIYNEIPKNITPDMIESIEVLKDAAATAIYGTRAVNGVVVVTTKTKTTREIFRDYAFWQPELITNKEGKIKFGVTYPDNVTAWQTYVLAMDAKLRIGKTSMLTQAYKPLLAQLSVPQFLVEGDSTVLIGKSFNYTADNYRIKTKFVINTVEKNIENNLLQPKASVISTASFVHTTTDTVKASFSLQTETGFKDGEERKIPVYKKGVEENTGQFMLLNRDTVVDFEMNAGYESLHISADNKTLDLLLKEIDHLKTYPYFCMEQTASKLSGLLMEKNIRKELNQSFKDEKLIKPLLDKLQKAQLFDGGWAWWENGKANFYITNYIINALLPLRADPLVETNIRNGLLYLQNQIDKLDKNTLLAALNTMAASHHVMDYTTYTGKLNFDSLSLHQQWQWVYVQQQIKGSYQSQLKQLINKQKASMLGGVYWGDENYYWYSNSIATTVLAYNVIKSEEAYKNLLPHIIQYFLEERKNGYWRNTVESASILSAILPDVLAENKNFAKPVDLKITGDTSFSINSFPYSVRLNNNIKKLRVQKSGGGLTYLSVYQNWFNKKPDAVTDKFAIKSYFKINNAIQQYITAGEKIKMVVDVDVKKDADFVMLQIPIPAGCVYAAKNQNDWNMHKEFYKDKVVMFAEKLITGKYTYEIELESRYAGKYILNPCKAELMYFPVFYGRNEIKRVEIK